MAEVSIPRPFKSPFFNAVLADVNVHLSWCCDFILSTHQKRGGIEGNVSWNIDAEGCVDLPSRKGERRACLPAVKGTHGTARWIRSSRRECHSLEEKEENEQEWACAVWVFHGVHRATVDGRPSSSLRRSWRGYVKIPCSSINSGGLSADENSKGLYDTG